MDPWRDDSGQGKRGHQNRAENRQASQTCTFGGGVIIRATRRSPHATSRQACPGGSELCHPTAERLQSPLSRDPWLTAEGGTTPAHHLSMTSIAPAQSPSHRRRE